MHIDPELICSPMSHEQHAVAVTHCWTCCVIRDVSDDAEQCQTGHTHPEDNHHGGRSGQTEINNEQIIELLDRV